MRDKKLDIRLTLLVAGVAFLAACQSPPVTTTATPDKATVGEVPRPTWTPLPTLPDLWLELLSHTPVPWTTPFPPEVSTVLDGTYVKNEISDPQSWNCRRCPDYRLAGGIWKLNLDKGVFRIYYTETSWRSLGSFTVDGERLSLFNDPYCQYETGVYTWRLEDGQLVLTEVDDPCSTTFRLRAANLTHMPWTACQVPPFKEGGTVTGGAEVETPPLGC